MYNQKVLDHFQNPRNFEEMKNPDATGMGANPTCGDILTLYFRVKDGAIANASYKTMGCGAAIASGSVLTEMLKGKTIVEAEKLTPQTLVEALGGLPAIKLHCPDLAIEALRATVANYKQRQNAAR